MKDYVHYFIFWQFYAKPQNITYFWIVFVRAISRSTYVGSGLCSSQSLVVLLRFICYITLKGP